MTGAAPLPDGFRVGVATAGYQIEGGYNGPGEPRNNWFRWEAEGRVEPSGNALDFWNRYEDVLDRAVAAGCDAFRLSVEWARCEPREGEIDEAAFDRYRSILDACHDRGLEPIVSLHHFTHPWWLGESFWLDAEAPARMAAWAGAAVERLGPSCSNWVTLNEINILAIETWLSGTFAPGGTVAMNKVVRTLDHLATAHVLAYDEVKRRFPAASAATNNFTFSLYELDRLLTDILTARLHGIDRDALGAWLTERRVEHAAATVPLTGPERFFRAWARRSIPLGAALPRTVDAVYASPHRCTLDTAQIDYYNPSVAGHFSWPGRRTSGGRAWLPTTDLWDDRPDPERFRSFVPLSTVPGRPLWIVENGLCNRVRNGRAFPRLDGWDRPRYLRAHLRAVVELLDEGLPIGGYLHWTLADNYEWGSYEPRFGLYGIDRARGNRWLATDAMGHDAAGVYRQIIEGLRAGDRSVLEDPTR
jgi:beta-glucosidase